MARYRLRPQSGLADRKSGLDHLDSRARPAVNASARRCPRSCRRTENEHAARREAPLGDGDPRRARPGRRRRRHLQRLDHDRLRRRAPLPVPRPAPPRPVEPRHAQAAGPPDGIEEPTGYLATADDASCDNGLTSSGQQAASIPLCPTCPIAECVDSTCNQDTGACTSTPKPDSTPCADTDGNACTTAGCDGQGVCNQAHLMCSTTTTITTTTTTVTTSTTVTTTTSSTSTTETTSTTVTPTTMPEMPPTTTTTST